MNVIECEFKDVDEVEVESKFEVKVEAKVCSMKETLKFLESLEESTNSKYNRSTGVNKPGVKGWVSEKLVCQFNVKTKNDDPEKF